MKSLPLVTAAMVALAFPAVTASTAAATAAEVSAPRAADRLVITVSGSSENGTWELSCAPAAGSHPDPAGACARLAELDRSQEGGPFAPAPQGQACTMVHGGPARATVTGTWHGAPVNRSFTRSDGCEISRWNGMRPVLPKA